MAVTQQLVRIPHDVAKQCSTDVELVERLVSFQLVAKDRYLDLNWWPGIFARLFAIADASLALWPTMRLAFSGSHRLNEHYLTWEIYSDLTVLEPTDVRGVSLALGRIELDAVLKLLPANLDAANKVLGCKFVEDPTPELIAAFNQLKSFYTRAAESAEATVMWWD